MSGLFSSTSLLSSGTYRAANGAVINLHDLPRFIRVLLTTNGTVTRSLEAYFMEPVEVKCVSQHPIRLTTSEPAMELDQGKNVLKRDVELIGTTSKQRYAKASTLINTDPLPSAVEQKLNEQKAGIGEVLLELGLETYREILELGKESDDCVWRKYRIIMEQHPIMLITEYFPLILYRDQV